MFQYNSQNPKNRSELGVRMLCMTTNNTWRTMVVWGVGSS